MSDSAIRHVSDTARWVAVFRARESERADGHFHDPYARALAGERGEQIARSMPFFERAAWAMIARTVVFDEFIAREIAAGADMVINLAAGLDARPYRMELPSSLQWIEADHAGILDYKEEVLRDATPRCALERVRIDLADADARRELFARLGSRAKKAIVLSEGLLLYLAEAQVEGLARDLAAQPSFHRWIVDIGSPGLLQMMKKQAGQSVKDAPFLFGPAEGPAFFERAGWRALDVRSMMKTADKLKRLPLMLRLFAKFPEKHPAGSRPWSGVCLLERMAR